MESVGFITNHHGVAGVVSTVEFHDVIDAVTQKIGRFAFSFITPLGADNDQGRHERTSVLRRKRPSQSTSPGRLGPQNGAVAPIGA